MSVSQDMVAEYTSHFMPSFKKMVRSGKRLLNLQKARVLEYSDTHASQVWVKYGGEDEQWVKFDLEIKGATPTIPTEPKYHKLYPVKLTKAADVKKLVNKYVPEEYRSFYDCIHGNEDISSETDESDDNQ